MFMLFNAIILIVAGLASAGAISADKAHDTGQCATPQVRSADCVQPGR